MIDPYEVADKAATEFPPTLSQKELEGLTFCIKGIRTVTTKFGVRHVAVIQKQGTEEDIEAWLGGVRVDRQLSALQQAEAFPAWFKLGRDTSIEGEPYILLKPDNAPPTPLPTYAKRLSDLGKEYGLTTERALELLEAKVKEGETARAAYKRIMDTMVETVGSREEANRLIYEKLVAKIAPVEETYDEAYEPEEELPFE
jgi:hypothetical protein